MGGLFSSIFDSLWGPYRYKLCLVGLDSAGKTSILYKLSLGEVVSTAPTIGSNVENLKYGNIEFTAWDLAGQKLFRSMWEGLIGTDTNALILVIDSSDRERMPVVKEELNKLLAMESLSKACLLLFANKQDLPDCMAPMEIVQELGLEESKRPFHIQGCSVINDNDGGLQAGIAWIASQLKH